MESFEKSVRKIRIFRGFTQKQLADLLGISPSGYWNKENEWRGKRFTEDQIRILKKELKFEFIEEKEEDRLSPEEKAVLTILGILTVSILLLFYFF